ncbi:MAG: deoxyribodipyrimidine photo-lyase [Candidatus Riflebacteria bacterium HGW-Riflebacteria-2]|jgi:deoxyribodipyrimidine photo-lyase|nr:MAG: deoxyribodipyrimidine photo-lyase [Candidatus Riflebacteria bacterium HGW-Riflebacteria-2]
MTALLWFRRDLRVNDNRALYNAVQAGGGVVAVAFVTPQQWQKQNEASAKISFWLAGLEELASRLAGLGIALHLEEVADNAAIPGALSRVSHQHACSALYFNREYGYYEQQRDESVQKTMQAQKIRIFAFDDRLLIEPGRLLTGSGGYYTVFTPFKKSWLGLLPRVDVDPLPVPDSVAASLSPRKLPLDEISHKLGLPDWCRDMWPAGELAAQKRLADFVRHGLEKYHESRDLPAVDGTSCLSPWLACGALSPRQCLAAVRRENKKWPAEGTGAETWLNELIWRDFYAHVVVGFPRVSRAQPFQKKTTALKWRYDDHDLQAWQTGQTGYPIVDAAMRQLNQTGWMHNRLRMVAAMFLSKHLLIDWRLGEKYFMQHLLDGDLAANNGGWQWSASTGTDAVPYFRIFNPFSQSQRFDANGSFIRRYCPELEPVSAAALHDPVKLASEIAKKKISYPAPVVDHKVARERALAAFKNL